MEYLDRILKSLDYIEKNLKEKISLVNIARESFFSPYHFHRVFMAMTGESVGEYIRKRRVTEAARELTNTNKKIIDIAFDYQYQSHEAFIRSFRRIYGISPGDYRKNKKSLTLFEKKAITKDKLLCLKEQITMKPRIIIKDEFKVIGIRGYSSINNNRIPELWTVFYSRIKEVKNIAQPMKCYGICEDIPDYKMPEFTNETDFSELVSVEVDNFDFIPEGMVSKIMPKAEYAVFTHKGSLKTLRDTYDYIYGTWFPNSGYEFGSSDDFELYDERFKGVDNPDSELDLYIPVIKA
jgi:AraC family transcriptional regulator